MFGINSVLNIYLLSEWMKNLVSIRPNLIILPSQNLSTDGTIYFRNASQAVYTFDFCQADFEMVENVICYFCLLTFMCVTCMKTWKKLLIFGMTTPICSRNHMPWYHSYCLSHLFSKQSYFWWRENKILSEGRICAGPRSDRPGCPLQGQTADIIDYGIVAALSITSHLQANIILIPAI